MSYSLKVYRSGKVVLDPTEADIRAVLDGSVGDGPLLALRTDGATQELQVTGSAQDGFALNYREGDSEHCWHSRKEDYSVEAALSVLTAFMQNKADWRESVEWQELSARTSPAADGLLETILRFLGFKQG